MKREFQICCNPAAAAAAEDGLGMVVLQLKDDLIEKYFRVPMECCLLPSLPVRTCPISHKIYAYLSFVQCRCSVFTLH